jgi:hypothetical protein
MLPTAAAGGTGSGSEAARFGAGTAPVGEAARCAAGSSPSLKELRAEVEAERKQFIAQRFKIPGVDVQQLFAEVELERHRCVAQHAQ